MGPEADKGLACGPVGSSPPAVHLEGEQLGGPLVWEPLLRSLQSPAWGSEEEGRPLPDQQEQVALSPPSGAAGSPPAVTAGAEGSGLKASGALLGDLRRPSGTEQAQLEDSN